MNTKPASELDALLQTIENGLDDWNLAADGQTEDSNYRKSALEALATLRERVKALETEQDALKQNQAILVTELEKYANLLHYTPYEHYPAHAVFHENDGGVVTIGDMRYADALVKQFKQS